MPVVSNFPTGSNGSSGLQLDSVSNIITKVSHGKVYIKWTDPNDIVASDSILAEWGGTLLVRKAGSYPVSRRDGTVVIDSKIRNQYQNDYFCDSGLTDGVVYYYKFFPYTTTYTYTKHDDCQFIATPVAPIMENVSDMSAEAAGNGKLAIRWTDPSATITEDGLILATWAKTTVVVKAGSYAITPDDSDAVYKFVSITHNAYVSTPLTATGLTNGTTYYVSFFPESTDGAVNKNTANRTIGEANRMTIITVPSQSGSLTYNGSVQTPAWSNYDSNKTTLNVTGQINAGTYDASFIPKDDYMWSDETINAKTVNWTIDKATGSLSIDPQTIILNMNNPTDQITVTRSGDGVISAVSNNTGIVTVSVSGNIITVNNVNQTSGSTTITVKVAAGTNYTAPEDKTVTVNTEFVSNVLNENSWDVIKAVSDSGQGDNYWDVGDTKTIVINGKVGNTTFSNLSIDAFIIGFNHNDSREGTKRIHFQFGKTALSDGTDICFVDSGYNTDKSSGTWFNMNNSWSNSGGWNSSRMRTVVCPAFMNAMPSDLRNVLKTVTKYSDNTGGGSNTASYVTATTDTIFLLAEYEVFGTRSYANSAEQNYQAQYQYYKNGNSKVKYRHSSTGSTASWWLRSVSTDASHFFCSVYTSGGVYSNGAVFSSGFAPAFCV